MNEERMKTLVNIYLNRQSEITDGETDTRSKWVAVSNCVKKWDIDADDFGRMFGDAMNKAAPLINTAKSSPVEGIRLLCKNERTEDVRDAFRDLLARDGGDLNLRQEHVLAFVKKINDLLAETVPDEWEVRQKVRTAVMYLALIRPTDNFMYRAPEVSAFAGYTEFDEELGYDRSFRMHNYHRLCDDMLDYVRTREDLINKVNASLDDKGRQIKDKDLPHIDPTMHILVYDIIDSAYHFDFYEDKAAKKGVKSSTVQQRKHEKMKKRAALLEEREQCVDRFDEVKAERRAAKIPKLQGKKVAHRAFGKGEIAEQDGRYLTVVFPEVTKKFALPGCIVNGFLDISGSQKIVDAVNRMEEVSKKYRDVENRLTSLDVQLQMLE